MNATVEMLNRWGDNFLSFAWPMLWQSSLLIALVFAFDFVSAKKIRASVRYALWLVVLVKLLLPPVLALPTGATWWLWRPKPVVETPVVKNYTVTVDDTAPPQIFVPPAVPFVPPPPKLNGEAWTLLASATVGAGLLLWLTFRWTRITRKIHSSVMPGALAGTLQEARQLAGLPGRIRVKLIDDRLSPAVYGLFRPVILLPLALTEKLSARQLRAVLLHEEIHLLRGDVWVNCAQTLLQIVYWWHPLLWIANARIRRVREEAVDDAVMAALRDGADAYAQTLLEVAKFAFRRPLASLGLVGIMESRSALRQRIERLVDFQAPRKAGITLLSLCGIFVFSAVALPMGEGPAQTANSLSANTSENETATNQSAPVHRQSVLIEGQFFRMTSDNLKNLTADAIRRRESEDITAHWTFDAALEKVTFQGKTAHWTADAEQFTKVEQRIKQFGLQPFQRLRIETAQGMEADMFCGTSTNWIKLNCVPYLDDQGITLDFQAESSSVFLNHSQLITNRCTISGKEMLDNKGGIIVSVKDINNINTATNLVVVLNVKNVGEVSAAGNSPLLPDQQKASGLEDEGHRFYDKGRFAEAEQDFSSALALGPANTNATRYWLHMATMRDQMLSIHLNQFGPYDKASLRQVVQDLNQEATNSGAVFHTYFYAGNSAERATNTVVTLKEMKDVSLAAAFAEIIDGASRPTIFSVEDTGDVKFSTGPERDLEMRTFKVDTNTFLANLQKASGIKTNMFASLLQFFSEAGVDFSAPKTVYLNGHGILFVSATPQDLKVIEHIVEQLNDPHFTNSPPKHMRATLYPPVILASTDKSQIVGDPPAKVDPAGLPKYEMRTFKVSTNVFLANLQKATGLQANVSASLVQLFSKAGVDFSPPKTVYYNERLGMLFVYATPHDLDVIERIVQLLVYLPPQIHIKARFFEVPAGPITFRDPQIVMDKGSAILTAATAKSFLQELESQKGAEELAEPEATLLSGRKVKMQASSTQPVVANYLYGEAAASSTLPIDSPKTFSDGSTITPKVVQVETGQFLDAVPTMLADGYEIKLQTTASQIEFLGYADTRKLPPHYATNDLGKKVKLPVTLPVFRTRQAEAQVNLYDGQTVLLFPQKITQDGSVYPGDEKSRELVAELARKADKKKSDKTLIVLVTATLVDAAGNRIHSEDELPFAQKRVPPNTNYFDLVPIP